MNKEVGVDIDGDGKPDLSLDLKTIILIVGGLISITMTYTTLTEQIQLNKQGIEEAKKLPPAKSHELIEQKLLYLEDMMDKLTKNHDKRLDNIEDKNMATQIGEDTQVQLDLKTIGMIVGGVIALASMWFTLQGDIKELQSQVAPEEFVKKMEFNLKDELIRTTIIQIDKSTKDLKEDIEDNKTAIKENTDKLYEITRKR